MKKKILYTSAVIVVSFALLSGCKKMLDEQIYSQLIPGTFLTTEDGIVSLLQAAYSYEGEMAGQRAVKGMISVQEWTTDIAWETSGADNRVASQIINFTWDASVPWFFTMLWQPPYQAIRDANAVLDNIDNTEIPDDKKQEFSAEARFIRAVSYYHLSVMFGGVPLRKSAKDSLELARASLQEVQSFVESELQAVIPLLPEPGKEAAYGRATSDAARAFLCKYYLNTKQWQKCADMAKAIMDGKHYELYPDYVAMFHVENERNKEFIWVRQATVNGPGNPWVSSNFPPAFKKDPNTGLTFQSNWRNFGAQYRLLDGFYNSFDANDKRKDLILTEYINNQGKTISLLNDDNTRSLKYWPDPNAVIGAHGNDIPEIRYADILLARAEALNELSGPNPESVDLVNKIRNRAGLGDIFLTDFLSKEALRDHILQERGWELYSEGVRREDLLRMGKFLEYAHDRGHTNAKDYMKLFPIPQAAMDANPALVQNDGY